MDPLLDSTWSGNTNILGNETRYHKPTKSPLMSFLPYFLSFIVFFPIMFVLCITLPPIWNTPLGTYPPKYPRLKLFSVDSYFPFVSPFSVWFVQFSGYDNVDPLSPGSDPSPTTWTMKFYVDTLVYFAYIYGIDAFSLLLKFAPMKFRRIFHRRLNIKPLGEFMVTSLCY